jgi:CheY-like chemotaxis protein
VTKILVIEDSKVMRLYIRGRLEEAGYEVEAWLPLSAMEIPEHILASAPDLILSDYQMPGCNGASVARMVQKTNSKIPLLILTSFKTEEMEATLQKFGVRQVLSKPIGAEPLIRAIADALGHGTA